MGSRMAATRLSSGVSRYGCRSSLPHAAAPLCPSVSVRSVRAKAQDGPPLSQWGDRSGPDEDAGTLDDGFERDTMIMVGRVLTARAVQLTLQQLGDTDLLTLQWLNNFCADNSPMRGDEFLLALISQAPAKVTDATSGQSRYVSPSDLAYRITTTRSTMAEFAASKVCSTVKASNMALLQQHLTRTSYTSGTTVPDARRTSRRGKGPGAPGARRPR